MPAPKFRRASKTAARLRMALVGPSGGGKTFSALAIAAGLGGRVAVIDTERASASKYAAPPSRSSDPRPGEFVFDTLELDHFHPLAYVEAIEAAEAEGYDVLIIDSLSHAWIGRGGELEMVDNAAKRSKGNSYTAWREVTPLHNQLIDSILRSSCHVIATMRSKVEYVLQANDRGKMEPRKIGMAPVQREGMDYEFDVVADLDLDHNLIVGKTRCAAIDGLVVNRPGEKLGRTLAAWLSDAEPAGRDASREEGPAAGPGATHDDGRPGEVIPNGRAVPKPFVARHEDAVVDAPVRDESTAPPPVDPNSPPPSTPDQHRAIMALVSELGMDFPAFDRMLRKRGVETLPEIDAWECQAIITKLTGVYESRNFAEGMAGDIRAAGPGEAGHPGDGTGGVGEGPSADGPADEPPDVNADEHVVPDATRKEKPAKQPKPRKPGKVTITGQDGVSEEVRELCEEALAN